MSQKDFENMSDEEFMDVLDNIDQFDNNIESEVDNEDTDQNQDDTETEVDGSETNQEDDDFFEDNDEDTSIEDQNGNEENSQEEIEDDNTGSEELGNNESEESSEADKATDDKADEPNNESNAQKGMTQEEIDYRKAYEEAISEKAKYEDFYKQVTSEFVANGKVIKGFDDPKKIIQAQQMAAGFSDKMKSFKQYRPFITPLKEKGIIDNPDKFNLMINALDGDKEAIKTLIQQAEIDPVELDMENIDYKPKNQISSDIEVAFEDVVDTAEQYGVRDKVEQVIAKDWDDNSVIELLEDPQNSADLVNHLSTGVYDLVQSRIAEKKMTDPYGAFNKKRAIDQYREAASELEQEYLIYLQEQEAMQYGNGNAQAEPGIQNNGFGSNASQFSEEEIQAEIERIKQEQEYKTNVNKRNAEADKSRRKAASVSRKKPKSRKKETKEFDVGSLSDEEFEELLNSFINE